MRFEPFAFVAFTFFSLSCAHARTESQSTKILQGISLSGRLDAISTYPLVRSDAETKKLILDFQSIHKGTHFSQVISALGRPDKKAIVPVVVKSVEKTVPDRGFSLKYYLRKNVAGKESTDRFLLFGFDADGIMNYSACVCDGV